MTKYEKIAEQIRGRIRINSEKGILSLPTEAEFCALYHCSRQTVRQALSLLKEEKLIESRQGSGYLVTGLLPDYEANGVAIVFPRNDDERHYSLINKLESALAADGYHIRLYLHEGDPNRERAILSELSRRPLRGLIVEPALSYMPSVNADIFERLNNSCNSIVFVRHRNSNLREFHGVFEKVRQGAYDLTSCLLNRDHKNIAALFRIDSSEGHDCFQGYSQALLDFTGEIPMDQVSWYTNRDHLEIEKELPNSLIRDFVENKLGSCSAVICQSDVIAYWLMKELQRRGVVIPDDIAVVSFGNSYLCNLSRPSLTSMGYTEEALADGILKLFTRQLLKKPAGDIYLDWTLNQRGSA